MDDALASLVAALLALALLWLGWWLFIASEGVYLGRRVVIRLYDLFAGRYEATKRFQPLYEQVLLARPLLESIAPHRSPMVLDVATGTARLPAALLEHADFQGSIIATDLSRGMLRVASHKLQGLEERCLLLRCPAEQLPFDDGSFDVVACLEALEFMTRPARVLEELMRVLRPGGLLFISNRCNTRLMPGKTWTHAQLTHLLRRSGAAAMRFEPWQVDYERVFVRKTGAASPVGARLAAELMRCPCCNRSALVSEDGRTMRCCRCGNLFQRDRAGVVDLVDWRAGC